MADMPSADAAALKKLRACLRGQPLALAFSGGLDSRFLAFVARQCGADMLLLHACGPHVPPAETACALRWAARQGLPLVQVAYDPLSLPGVAENSRERCYCCKSGLFARLADELAARGERRRLCDGTHADDLLRFRPGLRALREAGIWSPLAACGMGKEDIRRAAVALGMDDPEQKARPCLLTRLAYGLAPDAATLRAVAAAEQAVADVLAGSGMSAGQPADFRLRLTPLPVLQCTPLTAAGRETVLTALAARGFPDAILREEADISGFFDRPAGAS